VGSSLPLGWQVGWRLIYSLSEAWVLHLTVGKGFVVLDGLCCLCRISMPFQFELNKVTLLTTHSNYSVKILLDENFLNTFMLERRGIFTRDLGRATMRPIVEHNDASI
jgi:hypothetical protein